MVADDERFADHQRSTATNSISVTRVDLRNEPGGINLQELDFDQRFDRMDDVDDRLEEDSCVGKLSGF